MKPKPILVLTVATILAFPSAVLSQGTAFTYQGRLNDGPNPAAGSYDLRFAIYDSLTNGTLIAGPATNAATTVSGGLFITALDFGNVFDGNPRWLEIGVRTNTSLNSFIVLNPRQPLTAAPYSITAGNVTGPINGASIISGTVGSSQLATGAAAANLGASRQSGVASGGILTSPNANATDLLNAGYVRIGQTELGDFWQNRVPVVPSARNSHTAIWTGTEMIVWGGGDGVGSTPVNKTERYNPALKGVLLKWVGGN